MDHAPRPTIATATPEQIAEALAKNKTKEQKCQCCGKHYIPTRKWQRFCSSNCRDYFHSQDKIWQLEQLNLKYDALLRQNEALEEENEGLQRDLELLSRRLAPSD